MLTKMYHALPSTNSVLLYIYIYISPLSFFASKTTSIQTIYTYVVAYARLSSHNEEMEDLWMLGKKANGVCQS